MIKRDLVIPQATLLTSSFVPRLSRKVRRIFRISAPLDLKDSSHSAPVLALLAYRRVMEGRGSKWSRKIHVHAMALQWTHHRGTNRQEVCLQFLFFSTQGWWHSSTTVMASRASCYLEQNCNSEVQKSVWSPLNYCCANKHPSARLKLDESTFLTFIWLISVSMSLYYIYRFEFFMFFFFK